MSKTEIEKLMSDFWAWYQDPRQAAYLAEHLRRNAEFDAGSEQLGIEEFIWGVLHGESMTDVVLLEAVSSPERGALLFEGLDPITLLHYRVALFVTLAGSSIKRVRKLSMILPTEDD